MSLTSRISILTAVGALSLPATAFAQNGPLPPLPPSGEAQPSSPPGTAPTEAPVPAQDPAGAVVQRQEPPPPTIIIVNNPPPPEYQRTTQGTSGDYPMPKHAPEFSLFASGNVGIIGYGGNFFENAANASESTGNFVTPGASFELDVGARLGARYIPYLAWEHAFLAAGHRFEGTGATASSDYVGLGFRLIAGNVDNVGFLSELGIGFRTVTLAGNGETFKMTSLEIARLGLGAEIRLSTLFTLTPIAKLSVGQMDDTSGAIGYGKNQGDGQTGTTFYNGAIGQSPRNYVVVGLGCSANFDFFGK